MGGGKSATVLVVDDDEGTRLVLSELLSGEGFEVVLAEDGLRALEYLIRERRPDLILLDLVMPRMNAWQFVEAYRNLPEPHAPIVAMTAAEPGAAKALADMGIDDVLLKPFNLDYVIFLVTFYTS